MNRFLQIFLQDAQRSILFMRGEVQTLRKENDLPSIQSRRAIKNLFQSMHTLKGSAAAFELEAVSKLAHELENLLERLQFADEINFKTVEAFELGLDELENALLAIIKNDSYTPTRELPQIINDLSQHFAKTAETNQTTDFPAEFLSKLNQTEIEHLRRLQNADATIFIIKANFAIASFARELPVLRETLSKQGEIVATLPSELISNNEISLKIICGGRVDKEASEFLLNQFNAQIFYSSSNNIEQPVFADACEIAIRAGAVAAINCNKKIRFQITGETIELTPKQTAALSTAFLHLTRNAVAHGIESPEIRKERGKDECGLISLKAEKQNDFLRVTFSDDGSGINLEKSAEAASKIFGKQIGATEISFSEINKIIFYSGFSTANNINEIFGRGVGLDAAKSAVENIGGTIDAISSNESGTTFEITANYS